MTMITTTVRARRNARNESLRAGAGGGGTDPFFLRSRRHM
jgi:hypothetical protein